MTSRQSQLLLPPTLCLYRATSIAVFMLVSLGSLGVGRVAWGQGESLPAAVTEIWMSGEDLAVTRRIPRDRRSAQRSYDEVARSMVNMAESKYHDLDEKTVAWLHQWALELTDGRIGNSPRIGSRQWQPDKLAIPMPFESPEIEFLAPPIPDFDPAGLAIEWPISAFTDRSTPVEMQPTAHKSELPRDGQRNRSELVLVAKQAAKGGQSAEAESSRSATRPEPDEGPVAAPHANSAARIARRTELVVNPQAGPPHGAGRQVAVVSRNMQPGFANQLDHAAPIASTEQSATLALSCFAAGVVFCFVLHTLLLLTPVRLTVCRPSRPSRRTPQDSSAGLTRTGAAVEPARRAPMTSRPPVATRVVAVAQDKAGSMVEEFYNSNLELFEKFVQSVD